MKSEQIIYYTDPIHDDFAENQIKTKRVGEDFSFVIGNKIWNLFAFLLYYIVAIPIVWMIAKVYLGLKFENRDALKKVRGTGFFLYGNHTRELDAFLPALSAFPAKAYIIAHADAVSIPLLKNVVLMLGAIPIPTERNGMRGFLEAVSLRIREKQCVAIFPEAHIWPFYTGIRPFSATSFHYPVITKAPAIAMVITYRKRKGLFRFAKKPGMTISFSEPFYAKDNLSPKAAQKELRNQVYSFMTQVSSEKENIEYIKYVYKPRQDVPLAADLSGK